MNFHHIGVAVKNIQEGIKCYNDLGYTLQNDTIFQDDIQRVLICFMHQEGHPLIELIAPNSENSPVTKVLQKNGACPYHTCYEVDDLEAAILELRSKKYVPLAKPVPAIAFNNRHICFLLHKEIGLIELLQK